MNLKRRLEDNHDGIASTAAPDPLFQSEEARIRAAYARRQGDEIRYSWFNPAHLFMIQERERHVLSLLQRYNHAELKANKILEIGCGDGYWLREFIKWGARPENLAGIELLPVLVAAAKKLCPAAVNIQCGGATKLPFDDAAFDLVLQSTVFTSIIEAAMRQQIAAEMMRVTNKGGLILWYDYHVDNPWNPDVRGVKKREIRRLFAGCKVELQRITLAPPLLRILAPRSWMMAHCLAQIPFLCTHYLGVIRMRKT